MAAMMAPHAPTGVRGEDGRFRGEGVAAPRRAPPRGGAGGRRARLPRDRTVSSSSTRGTSRSARAPRSREGDRLATGRRRPARVGGDQPRGSVGNVREARRCLRIDGGGRGGRRWRRAGPVHDRRGVLRGDVGVPRDRRLSARQRVGGGVEALVRTAGHQRLPGDLPRPSGRIHAAHGCVGRRRLGGGDGVG